MKNKTGLVRDWIQTHKFYMMREAWKNNSLSIVFFVLFILAFCGQVYTGFKEHNKENLEEGSPAIKLNTYLSSGHFLQATFENWESEFLQMALFVVLTVSLRQKGSSESKKFEPEEVDREPSNKRKDAPWPVHKGGMLLKIYQHSLSIVLFLLFAISFVVHLYGSLKDENEHLIQLGLPVQNIGGYLSGGRFWFESFQNWQSEFLSVFAIVALSIYLREKGSPQSKPVDEAHSTTGE
ncbi:MAG: DUF6766 family protein [Chitinophagaceae bacterium]